MTEEIGTKGNGFLEMLSSELAAAVERVSESVVRVDARRGNSATGIVWSSGGHILTADHGIEREDDIKVHLADGGSHRATLVARDPGSDLALLGVDATGLTPAEHASFDALRVGSLVMAVGRPGASGHMATMGIISAIGGVWRTARGSQLPGYVRADATLYPGFSGGPLVDVAGRVVGINSWMLSQGAGFAVPVGVAAGLADALQKGGVKRAFLGVGTQVVPITHRVREQVGAQETGLIVLSLVPGGPAEMSGLLIGDVLISLDGHPLTDADDLQAQLTPERVGTTAQLQVVSGGELKNVTVRLGQRE